MALVTRLLAGKSSMQVSDALTGSINLPSAGLEVGDMELISRITLNSTQATVTFGGIPQTYKNLQIISTVMCNASTNPTWKVNGDTTTGNYRGHHVWGTGSITSANDQSGTVYWNYNPNTSYPSIAVIDWYDYTSSRYKTMQSFAGCNTNGGTAEIALWSGMYMSSNPINSITLEGGGNSFTSGSTFSLYGIRG